MSNISYKNGKEGYHWFTCAVEFQQSDKNQTRLVNEKWKSQI